jgi:pimeloyl-ACP methyl ester carboxylesterase
VEQRKQQIAGVEVAWREAPSRGMAAPVVYVHGVPSSSSDWLPFLERTGGYALDLPGFGESGKPAHFDYSIDGYGAFLRAFVDELGLDRFSLVMHDWGSLGLALAQLVPDRVERIVAIAVVPFTEGYRWHRVARVWRTPLLGELFMGYSFKWGMKRASREWLAAEGPAPAEMVDEVWRHWDHGTQRAILKLYRSAPPAVLEAAGAGLPAVTAPALIAWGEDDPYLPPSFARALADRLGGPAEVSVLEGARHWPWLDRPELVDRVVEFLVPQA